MKTSRLIPVAALALCGCPWVEPVEPFCPEGLADCDGDLSNECEVALDSIAHCGACGNACYTPHATAACSQGACAIGSCDLRYQDCDGDVANGCERWLVGDDENCGACGNVCADGTSCIGGACRPPFLVGFGGRVVEGITPPVDSLWTFDLATGAFANLYAAAPEGAPKGRTGHIAVWDRVHQRMLLFTGVIEPVEEADWRIWALQFDIDGPRWEVLNEDPDSPGDRGSAASAVDWERRLVWVFGGQDVNFDSRGDLWTLDLDTATWTRIHGDGTISAPGRRDAAAATFLGTTDEFVLYGGYDRLVDDDGPGGLEGTDVGELWSLDTTQSPPLWRLVDDSDPLGKRSGASFFPGTGTLFGGIVDSRAQTLRVTNDLWEASTASSAAWTNLVPEGAAGSPGPRGRYSEAGNGRVSYVFGGRATSSWLLPKGHNYNDLWRYDANGTWTLLSPDGAANAPSPRYGGSLVLVE